MHFYLYHINFILAILWKSLACYHLSVLKIFSYDCCIPVSQRVTEKVHNKSFLEVWNVYCLSAFRWFFPYLAIFSTRLSNLWGSTIFNCVLMFPLYIKMNNWGIETHQGSHTLTNMVWFGKFNAFWMLGCWIKNLMCFYTAVYMLQQNDHHQEPIKWSLHRH